MATYQFSFITSPEAAGYQAGRDDLRFDGVAGATATRITVTGSYLVQVIGGGSVTLGFGADGEILTLNDGSKLVFPSASTVPILGGSAGDHIYGGDGTDAIDGLAGDDWLEGGAFNDTLTGGSGADTLTGGSGQDAFVFAPGDSGTSESRLDAVTDFSTGDIIRFTTPMSGLPVLSIIAPSYDDALRQANTYIAAGQSDVVVARVNGQAYLFADTKNDNGVADDAILFQQDVRIGPENIVGLGSPATPTPTPTPTPPATPTASPPGTLVFEQLSANQALGYDSAIHDLQFQASRAGSTVTLVYFNADNTVTIISGAETNNRVVTFGPGIYGENNLIFPDNTRVLIGTAGGDLMMGTTTIDRLYGGPGNDTLNGGGNSDVLAGGAGADLFVIDSRDARTNTADSILDWEPIDRITFGGTVAATAANYVEVGSSAEAEAKILSGEADFAAYQGTNVLTGQATVSIVADAFGTNTITGRVSFVGRLDALDHTNFVANLPIDFPALAPLPGVATTAAPGPVIHVGGARRQGGGEIEGNMDSLTFSLPGGLVNLYTATQFSAGNANNYFQLMGAGFTYAETPTLITDIPTGVVTNVSMGVASEGFRASLSGVGVSGHTMFQWVINGATQEAFATVLGGNDEIRGGQFHDLIRGLTGADTLGGMGGNDTLYGGAGDDVIYAVGPLEWISSPNGRSGATYLRGDEGNDWIGGGTGFDDINGNMGNDTAGGGPGDDWVVGGKDNDLLFGDDGNDLVYGNLGNDTCEGGAGNDTIRGGQDDDVVSGGAGNDYVSGDRGNDTMTGGAGADIFHTFGEAGIDRVTDFRAADGDRVQVDPGTQYTLAQVGADTVINMTGGGQMILVGVQMSSLPAGWIFGA